MGSGFRTFTAGEVLTASNVQNYLQDQVVMTFAGSAARSSAIGTANFEEGMTSYLTDTDKMEVYNGTNWVSVAPTTTQGLTLINTTSFSGVASHSLNAGTFNSTYTNYRMIANVQASTGTTLQLRVRAAGTDQTAASYFSFGFSGGFGAVTQLNLATQTSSRIHQISGDITNYFIMDISKPNENTPTIFDIRAYYPDGGSHMTQTSVYNTNFQADSLTIFPASGTITGTYSVYGYNK